MRWGQRRAERLAIRSGRSRASSKRFREETEKHASKFEKEAKDLDRAANSLNRKGKLGRAITVSLYSNSKAEKAKEIREQGGRYESYYKVIAQSRGKKARELAAKYGDAAFQKRIESLIRENSNKPYKTFALDVEDPAITAIKSVFEGD